MTRLISLLQLTRSHPILNLWRTCVCGLKLEPETKITKVMSASFSILVVLVITEQINITVQVHRLRTVRV
jgi:hypothetical protein